MLSSDFWSFIMDEKKFCTLLEKKEKRKLKALQQKKGSILSRIGTIGSIGWTIATPMVLGAVLGHWLDKHTHGTTSWTISFLMFGLFAGCFSAWKWVAKEYDDVEDDNKNE